MKDPKDSDFQSDYVKGFLDHMAFQEKKKREKEKSGSDSDMEYDGYGDDEECMSLSRDKIQLR